MAELEKDDLELLELEDDSDIEQLGGDPFASPRPRRPWLFIGLGVLIIAMAVFIILRVVGTGSRDSLDIDLDAPVVESSVPAAGDGFTESADRVINGQADSVAVAPKKEVHAPAPVQETAPVREITDRAEVKFDSAKKSASSKPKPVAAPAKPAAAAATAAYYVQFGSYSTRALAESAQKKIRANHANLFSGKQFVVLSAVLPNGTTTYRLRVGFKTVEDANGFCRNAKSDGLECYITK
ncbi:MAG: SPOR domain-containing protein [Rickettsiales bacterium]|jgi:cell division septation protein DedD|nr:SPOR domain-containing protein [Rickettsiales bacterium]